MCKRTLSSGCGRVVLPSRSRLSAEKNTKRAVECFSQGKVSVFSIFRSLRLATGEYDGHPHSGIRNISTMVVLESKGVDWLLHTLSTRHCKVHGVPYDEQICENSEVRDHVLGGNETNNPHRFVRVLTLSSMSHTQILPSSTAFVSLQQIPKLYKIRISNCFANRVADPTTFRSAPSSTRVRTGRYFALPLTTGGC